MYVIEEALKARLNVSISVLSTMDVEMTAFLLPMINVYKHVCMHEVIRTENGMVLRVVSHCHKSSSIEKSCKEM